MMRKFVPLFVVVDVASWIRGMSSTFWSMTSFDPEDAGRDERDADDEGDADAPEQGAERCSGRTHGARHGTDGPSARRAGRRRGWGRTPPWGAARVQEQAAGDGRHGSTVSRCD